MFVKICGITTGADAIAATDAGTDAIGVNFVPTSTRFVDSLTAAAIVGVVRDRTGGRVMVVGVFSDHRADDVVTIVNELGLDAAQLHGGESPSVVDAIAAALPDGVVAFKVFSPDSLSAIADYDTDIVMVDAPNGGGGQVFDWSIVGDLSSRRRVLLAGGLTPDNVARAIAVVRPWGVDVATGVESSPGRKDPVLMSQFVTAARSAHSI